MSLTEPHNEFLELCAVSTSGQLTEEEQKKLQEHLAVCGSCRETLKQYESVVDQAIPVFVAKEASKGQDPGPDWSKDQRRQAEHAFFKRLEGDAPRRPKKSTSTSEAFTAPRRLPPFSSESAWRHVWMLYAAGILLFVSLSFYAYRMGVHRGADTAILAPPQPTALIQTPLEAQLSDAGHERQMARDEIDQRDTIIAELRQQSAKQLAQINGLKAVKHRLENDLRSGDMARQDLALQRGELTQKLDAVLSSSQALQQTLDSLVSAVSPRCTACQNLGCQSQRSQPAAARSRGSARPEG